MIIIGILLVLTIAWIYYLQGKCDALDIKCRTLQATLYKSIADRDSMINALNISLRQINGEVLSAKLEERSKHQCYYFV